MLRFSDVTAIPAPLCIRGWVRGFLLLSRRTPMTVMVNLTSSSKLTRKGCTPLSSAQPVTFHFRTMMGSTVDDGVELGVNVPGRGQGPRV